jgi:putative nucleotidyltransferase with HDIG domain
MPGRPSRTVIALEVGALALAAGLAVVRAGEADWDLPLFLTLLIVSVAGDLTAVDTATSRVKLSSSFLAIVVAVVFLGESPAALIGVLTILAGWTRWRYSRQDLLINLVTYAWFPLLSGIAFHEIVDATGVSDTEPGFYLLIVGLFAVALLLDFTTIAGYSSYLEGTRLGAKFRRSLMPLLPSEVASALIAIAIAYVYVRLGTPSVALFGVVIIAFQMLIGALLVSQQRADELELRNRQLAGFQVALLSALLRTLDLRDRMTARHSASVARHAREIARVAGLSHEEQDAAHTAGLLHDIGKFVLPDRILKGNVDLTDADWEQVKRHPDEGARIVSQIEGYRPIAEIIRAHHERIDGRGYPRGLSGDEIPELARIVAIADTYDVMTARDTYREPLSSADAINELRQVAGTQLDARLVDVFIATLAGKDLAYRVGEDVDFERELALDRRIHDYVGATESTRPAAAGNELSRVHT